LVFAIQFRTKFEPINPAPPVTNTVSFMPLPLSPQGPAERSRF
jgi:hypothetical protein